MLYWILMFLYIFLNGLGLFLLKSGFNSLNNINLSMQFVFDFLKSFKLVTGFILYIASFMTWLILISKKDISFAIPIMIGLLYFSTAFVSFVLLKESLNIMKLIGMSLILAGIIVIILQGGST